MANISSNIPTNSNERCITMPPTINSKGMMNGFDPNSNYGLPKLELQISLILIISQACHFFLRKLGVPILTSQIIAGIIVGPWLRENYFLKESDASVQVIGTVAALGYGLFIFLSAVKTDVSIIKSSGIRPIIIGLVSFISPLTFSFLNLKFKKDESKGPGIENLFFASTFSMSSFPVIAMLLDQMKILNSELGRLGLASALTTDFLSIFAGASGFLFNNVMEHKSEAMYTAIKIIALIGSMIFLRWVMKMVIKAVVDDGKIDDSFVYGVLFLFLVAISLTFVNGMLLILMPFILGLAVPEGPPLGSAVVDKIEYIVSNLLVPISVATISMRFDFSLIDFNERMIQHYTMICITTLILKFLVSFIAALLLCNMPTKDAAALALILNNRGIVELGLYSMANDMKLMETGLYTTLSLIFIGMATIVPVLVKLLHDPSRKYAAYQKRNLMSLKVNEDVQIVTCIHVPGDINPTINLLTVVCPTRENPIVVNVLHLVKLVGRSSPLFISHERKPTTVVSQVSYFENATVLFYQFEQNNWGAVSVNAFTAVSPTTSMHEDICNLALKKQTSLILLPFHRKWSNDGTIESEDIETKALNATILEASPCSVGILIDRSALRRHFIHAEEAALDSHAPSFKAAMIFLGGDDDREALIFAKRIAYDANATLTVVVLKAAETMNEWERMLDSYLLRETKNTPGIIFKETNVEGGTETAAILRPVAQEYDLVVVGRRNDVNSRQTSGLKEWSEFPELGIVGDLLASHDLEGNCSILVIQQQKIDL